MKKAVCILVCMFLMYSAVFSEGTNTPDTGTDIQGVEMAKGGVSVVPEARRPAESDKKKCEEAALNDESADDVKNYKDTLSYGISPEIITLIQKFITNDDPRFVDNVYDLFQTTKSSAVREKIIEYFTHFKDPCIEDYAVTILNDPYDTKSSTVSLVFNYISEVECTEAIPAVIALIDADNETYFQDALTTLGNIGGPPEALYLAEYMDRNDLTVVQKQTLARVLGKIHAVETWGKLAELAQNKDENTFVRMYSAESIGEMQKPESVPVLINLYEENDPNLRQYVIKGLSNYPDNSDAQTVIIQGIKDEHYKVRLESIAAVKKLSIKKAMPYLIYRTKASKEEQVVKNACYPVIAGLNTQDGNAYLVSILTDGQISDGTKEQVVNALVKDNNAGEKEILNLAAETLKDDKRKTLRYAIGKQLADYARPSYDQVCRDFMASKDAVTVSLGIDMYKKGKYPAAADTIKSVANDKKAGGNQKKARKILGLPDEEPEDKTSGSSKETAKDAAQ